MTTATTPRPVVARVPLHAWTAVGFLGAVGMVLAGSTIGSIPQPAADRWWFTIGSTTGIVPHLAFYASVAILLAGWIGVGSHAYRGGLSVRAAWLILVLWGLPFFVGAPLFSRDIYSYVAQGQLARSGLDPYKVAPSALGPGNLLSSVASKWRHSASPYGPLFVSLSHAAASVGGNSMVRQVLAFRTLELGGVALMMVSLPPLARRLGNDPGIALWLGVLSPLALFSFVSSGHNDALMVGLMLAGVTLGTAGWLRSGVALCVLAATIKLPALAGAVFLTAGACTGVTGVKRWGVIAESAAITAVVLVGVTLGAGFGWTWLGPTALHVPTELRVVITPLVSVGSFVGAVIHAVGIPVSRGTVITVVLTLGELVAVLAVLWMAFHTRGRGAVRLLGLSLVLFVFLSPTVWPWYWMWGVAVLAATSAQRSKALAALAALGMFVVGAGGTPLLNGGDFWVTGPLVVIVAAWFLISGRWRLVVDGPGHNGAIERPAGAVPGGVHGA